jgi:hypothetical protein
VVHQSARSGHDDVRSLRESDLLIHLRDAADDGRAADAYRRAERLKLLRDLEGELARGREDAGEEPARVLPERLEDGQREGGGFAGAGGGDADDVAALESMGESLDLDVGGDGELELLEHFQQRVDEAERAERRRSLFSRSWTGARAGAMAMA